MTPETIEPEERKFEAPRAYRCAYAVNENGHVMEMTVPIVSLV